MRKLSLALIVLVAAAAAVSAARQPAAPLDARLAMLGKVWLAAKFSHPRVALTARDWDAVIEKALPEVRAAGNAASFAAVVGAMLASLDDPVTRIEGPGGNRAPERPGRGAVVTYTEDGTPVLDRRGAMALAGRSAQQVLEAFIPQVPTACPRGYRPWRKPVIASVRSTVPGSSLPG